MGQNSADQGAGAVVVVVAGDAPRAGELVKALSDKGLRAAVFDPGEADAGVAAVQVGQMVTELQGRGPSGPDRLCGP